MRPAHPDKRSGVSALETMLLITMVSVSVLVAANFIKIPGYSLFGTFGADKRMVELVAKEKKEAALVLTGKIVDISNQIQDNTDKGDNVVTVHGRWTVEIESVERGRYSGKQISFYVGWWSNRAPAEEFPKGLKTRYKTGERVRVYLAYGVPGSGMDAPAYYTRSAYYCLGSLDFQSDPAF